MAFDPSLPLNGSLIVAAELRSQYQGLKDEIDALPTQAQLSNDLVNTENAAVNTALPLTSSNSNAVSFLSTIADGSYNPAQLDELIQKMNELIGALRR